MIMADHPDLHFYKSLQVLTERKFEHLTLKRKTHFKRSTLLTDLLYRTVPSEQTRLKLED